MKDIEIQDQLEKLIAKIGMKQVVIALTEISHREAIKAATEAHDMNQAKIWLKCALGLEVLKDMALP